MLMTLIGLLPARAVDPSGKIKKVPRMISRSSNRHLIASSRRARVDADVFRHVLLPEVHYQSFGKKLALIILAASSSLLVWLQA